VTYVTREHTLPKFYKLINHSNNMSKITREKFKTKHNVFDDFTNRTLYKLISQGHFEGLVSPVSIGKESNIFTARKDGKLIIVKIYRLETADFNKMYSYIRDDPRYKLSKQKRKTVFAWCQREYRNLMIAREAGVRTPLPLAFANNVLVMEMIGKDEPASKLKDEIPKNKRKFFNEIIDSVRKLYKAGFVHADLSQFNILNYNEKPVFIDFSHMTPTKNHNSEEYLERDIKVICNYFTRLKLKIDKDKIIKSLKNQPQ